MNQKIDVEEIAQPQCRLPVVNIFSQHLPERKLIADIAYSDLWKTALFLINTENLEDEKFPLPEGSNCGMRAFSKGIDGKLYFASGNGSLYSFDIENKSFRKNVVFSEKSCCCTTLYASSSGKIYVGTYPKGDFFQCDPKTGESKRVSVFHEENTGCYCSGFIDLPDGRMLVMITGAKPTIAIFYPDSGKSEIVHRGDPERDIRGFFNGFLDEDRIIANLYDSVKVFNWKKMLFEGEFFKNEFDDHIFMMEKAGDDYYFCGPLSRKMYKYGGSSVTVVKDDFPAFNMVNNLHHLGGKEFICLGDNGLVMKFDLETGKFASRQIDNISNDGMALQFLSKIPERDILVGAHFINSQMFNIDMKKKSSEASLNKVVPTPGQLNCGTTLNGKFYIGSYVNALVSEYDYDKPFVQGENPRVIAKINEGQNRPIDIVNDGKLLYIASMAQYGLTGGAITVLDPVSQKMEIYRNFVKGQNPTSLFYWPKKRCLAGSTDIYGDCGTAKPEASNATLFLWDVAERKTVSVAAPWEMPRLKIIDVSPSGVCFCPQKLPGQESGEYSLWDIGTGSLETKKWPLKGVFIGGAFMNDKVFCGATEHGLFALDIKSNEFEMLTETTKETGSYCSRCFVKLSDNEFLFDKEGKTIMKAILKR